MSAEKRIDYEKFVANVPDELKKLPNWVGCRIVPSKDRLGKTDVTAPKGGFRNPSDHRAHQ